MISHLIATQSSLVIKSRLVRDIYDHGRYVTYTGFVKIDNPEGGQRGLNQRSPGSNQSNLPNNFS